MQFLNLDVGAFSIVVRKMLFRRMSSVLKDDRGAQLQGGSSEAQSEITAPNVHLS